MAFTKEQVKNARTIIQVGHQLGASQRDIQVALMAAIVESGLRAVNYGDRDSLGIFQQRSAWGSREQRLDVASSARMFFLGGHGGQQGLLDIRNRDSRSLGSLAQDVQVSAFPDRYAEHQHEAGQLLRGNADVAPGGGLLGSLANIGTMVTDAVGRTNETVEKQDRIEARAAAQDDEPAQPYLTPAIQQTNSNTPGVAQASAPMSLAELPDDSAFTFPKDKDGGLDLSALGGSHGGPFSRQVIQFAKKFLGTPYVWGGTSPQGFDCSGFVQYVYKHMGIDLPRISADQARAGRRIGLDDLRPGDLVGWDNSSRNHGADHIAIYIGHGRIIEAPRPGLSVQISSLYDQGQAWGVRMHR